VPASKVRMPNYYVPELVSPFKQWKYRVFDKRQAMPTFPEHVQIQTVSHCNANCIFCPNKKTSLEIPIGKRMSMELWKKLIDEIVQSPVRRMSPYLMNESTLDPDLPERIAYFAQRKRPGQYSKINSHGNALNERMALEIMKAGLDRINFSVQGIDPDDYFKVMSLKFEKTVRNIERMIELKKEHNLKTRIRVVMLVTRYLEPHIAEVREFWKKRGVKIHLNQLENRGHHDKIQSDAIAVHELQTYSWCDRLFNQMYILYDGRTVMCCADWEQTSMMGDVSKNTIREVWNNDTYKDYRKRYLTGNVKGLICDGCTKDGDAPDEDDAG